MKKIYSFKYFLLLIIASIFISENLFPQNRSERNRDNVGSRNDQPGYTGKTSDKEERKEHTGITIDRPDRRAPDPIPPKRNDPPPYNPPAYNPPAYNPPAYNPPVYNPPPPVYDPPPPHDPLPDPPPPPDPPEPEIIIVAPEEPLPEIKEPREPENLSRIQTGLAKIYDLDYTGAVEDFTYAIEEDTSNYKLYYYRGFALLNLKEYLKSIKDFDIYLKYFFYDDEGFFQRALAKFYLGEKLLALEDFKTAAELGHKKAATIINKFYQ